MKQQKNSKTVLEALMVRVYVWFEKQRHTAYTSNLSKDQRSFAVIGALIKVIKITELTAEEKKFIHRELEGIRVEFEDLSWSASYVKVLEWLSEYNKETA